MLMIGRLNVVSSPTSTSKKSARCEIWKSTLSAPFSAPTLPAPVNTWRVTKKGIRCLTSDGERHLAVDEVVLVAAVRVALAVGVVLVDEDRSRPRARCAWAALDRILEDPLPRLVPDDAVARVRALGARVLGMRVIDVVAGAVREDDVDQPGVVLGGASGGSPLEAARVAQRVLFLVVPLHPLERRLRRRR